MTLYSSYTPDFKCNSDGNGKGVVNANVALITYDEVVYAGGYYSMDNDNNYLYNGNSNNFFYTMSPSGSDGTTSFLWVMGRYIGCGSVSGIYLLRPVINLKNDVIVSGNGKSSNPYQL